MSILRKLINTAFLVFVGVVMFFGASCAEGITGTTTKLDTPNDVRVDALGNDVYVFYEKVQNATSYNIYVYNELGGTVLFKYNATGDDGFSGYVINLNNGLYNIAVSATSDKANESDKSELIAIEVKNDSTVRRFTITYNLDGGVLPTGAPAEYVVGTGCTLPTPTKEGYTFLGWYTSASHTGNAITEITTSEQGDKTFYAAWQNNSNPDVETYTITYYLNGGQLDGSQRTSYEKGSTYMLPVPTKSGYKFAGWYANVGLTGSVYSAIMATDTGNKSFYAAWELEGGGASDLEPYYISADGKMGAALKSALRDVLVSTHKKRLTYDDLKTQLPITDADPKDSSKMLLLFSHEQVVAKWDGAATWNREHVWPQSKGWFTTSGAGADVHHLRPEDPTVNGVHGNTAYGELNGGGKTLSYKGKVVAHYGTYFEPNDDFKGDIARIIFYLLVRYSESDSYNITAVAQSMDMLLRWNDLDPVDDFEVVRNERSYTVQGNRNPFIDHPEFARMIWG